MDWDAFAKPALRPKASCGNERREISDSSATVGRPFQLLGVGLDPSTRFRNVIRRGSSVAIRAIYHFRIYDGILLVFYFYQFK